MKTALQPVHPNALLCGIRRRRNPPAKGGFKPSGVGREGGVEGLRPYLEPKTILMDGKPGHLS